MKCLCAYFMKTVKKSKQIIYGIIFLIFSAIIYVFAFVNSISQDILYHNFADTRVLFNITNFWNVISNLPFFLVGIYALYRMIIIKSLVFIDDIKWSYIFLFLGVALVSFGSGYYHLNPTNETLVWDRLPMTIAFMALFAIVISEFISIKTGKQFLFPLLILGLFSVLYWFFSEMNGYGDLRLYILIQFLPILIIPIVLISFPSLFSHIKGYWLLLLCYVLAKLLEHFDMQIFTTLSFISGHSLKHIVAALGIFLLLRSYEERVLL